METVPVQNQVYEFLDRMAVKGILPLYLNTMLPKTRKEIGEYLILVREKDMKLTRAEKDFLTKFENEFIHEINPSSEDNSVLLKSPLFKDFFSDKEKYLYEFRDSILTCYVEGLASIDYRLDSINSSRKRNVTLAEIGLRLRGTVKNDLGYSFRATNGKIFGNRNLALSDPRLQGNVKFNDLKDNYFDFVEAYLRADLDWFDLQFGREQLLMGTGYSDRLLLSNNAPVFDAIKLDFHHKWFRFTFIHGSLVNDSIFSSDVKVNKYFAMHRAEFSIGEFINVGLSEMIIYQRQAMEFAYLNPINFYKSSEHSLKDRDNAFVSLDLQIFPLSNYKLYGTWLIDDIDFGKMGTGWWGNEFGWQGGIYVTNMGNIDDVDALIEYTRIEPYVYSNRIAGNNYSHKSISLGHHIGPNSDEWLFEMLYRPMSRLRTRLGFSIMRHGMNYDENGNFVNVGGDVLIGHSDSDSETVKFLGGILEKTSRLRFRFDYEPINNFFISGMYEYSNLKFANRLYKTEDHFAALRIFVEY